MSSPGLDLPDATANVDALDVDVVVVGAGLMGSATAWELSRRGRSVALVEALAVGHDRGSSHGASRIFRRAYADPMYVAMTGRAGERWRELELDSGSPLLTRTGGLDHGRRRDPALLEQRLTGAGVACELLTAAQAGARWPGLRFDGPVLHHPEAGVVDAAAAVAAMVERARARGAHVLAGTQVRSAEVLASHAGGAGRVRVRTDGTTLTADTVVVAAGAWLPDLAGHLGVRLDLPALRVTQQQVFHFASREPGTTWPVFVHKDEMSTYGLPSDRDAGPGSVKVAQHDGGALTSAAARDGVVDPAARARIVEHVGRWLPGLDPQPVAETTCLYTSTPDEDFVLDRVGPVVVASPCSGHGAKFAPLVGQLAADLATGVATANPRFALGARLVPA